MDAPPLCCNNFPKCASIFNLASCADLAFFKFDIECTVGEHNSLQEDTLTKRKEAQENAEATEAADALCNVTPVDDASAGESAGASAGAEIAPPSLLTGVSTNDGDATDDVAAAAADVAALEDAAAPDDPAAEPEPYTASDIQVCNVPYIHSIHCG